MDTDGDCIVGLFVMWELNEEVSDIEPNAKSTETPYAAHYLPSIFHPPVDELGLGD